MVNCIDIQDPGLSLLPYHRGLQSLTEEDIDKLESTLIEYFEEQFRRGIRDQFQIPTLLLPVQESAEPHPSSVCDQS